MERQKTLHVIASCTNRKSVSIAEELRLRSIPRGDVERRVEAWWRRLCPARGQAVPALSLYCGNHWAVVRSLPGLARQCGLKSTLWVLSAGYGLIRSETLVQGYSATFGYKAADAVGRNAEEAALWWTSLSRRVMPGWNSPRTLEDLFKSDPHAAYMLIASPNYLVAVASDLTAGVNGNQGEAQVVIVSSPNRLKGTGLESYCIPSEAPLRHVVGGPLSSLHARVARRVLPELANCGFRAVDLQTAYARLSRGLRITKRLPARVHQADREVRSYIRAAFAAGTAASYTSLLRRMRDEGLACEAHRFKLLYLEEKRGRGVHVA